MYGIIRALQRLVRKYIFEEKGKIVEILERVTDMLRKVLCVVKIKSYIKIYVVIETVDIIFAILK